jgi:hypothetical protein
VCWGTTWELGGGETHGNMMGARQQDLVLCIDEFLNFFLGCCFMMQALKFVSFPVQTLCNVWRNDTSHDEVNPFFLGTKELSVSLCVLSLSSNLCSRVSLLRFDGFTRTFQDKLFKGYNMGICNPVIYVTLGSYGLGFNRFIYTYVCSCAPVLFSILARSSILRFYTR